MNTFKRFFADEQGLETIEYAIIAGLIVVGIIAVMSTIGGKILQKFNNLNANL